MLLQKITTIYTNFKNEESLLKRKVVKNFYFNFQPMVIVRIYVDISNYIGIA